MDISTYWQTIKKQSKELTGVDKINAGIFHGSGIGSSLEDYIKAVKTGDPKKILKAAGKAHTKAEKYLNTIHKKELATGKKAMKPNQLKSAKIVGDALEKIVEQLDAVVNGDALAGTFDEDAEIDAAKSNEPVPPNVKKKSEENIALRRRMKAEAPKLLASYKTQAKPIDNLMKLAKRGAADAKATKQSGDTFNNMQAIAQAQRAAEEIAEIAETIKNHYSTNVVDQKSDYMKARGDVSKGMPKWFQKEHAKVANPLWAAVDKVLSQILSFTRELSQSVSEAEAYAEVAESFSMQGIDPSKQLAKLEKLKSDVEKQKQLIDRELHRVKNVPKLIERLGDTSSPVGDRHKQSVSYVTDVTKRIGLVVGGIKQARTLRSRLSAIGTRAEDSAVLAAVDEVATLLDGIDEATNGFEALARGTMTNLLKAQKILTAEMA